MLNFQSQLSQHSLEIHVIHILRSQCFFHYCGVCFVLQIILSSASWPLTLCDLWKDLLGALWGTQAVRGQAWARKSPTGGIVEEPRKETVLKSSWTAQRMLIFFMGRTSKCVLAHIKCSFMKNMIDGYVFCPLSSIRYH